MQNKDKNYLWLILIHILIGWVIYIVPQMSKLFGYFILIAGLIILIKSQNKKNEAAGALKTSALLIKWTRMQYSSLWQACSSACFAFDFIDEFCTERENSKMERGAEFFKETENETSGGQSFPQYAINIYALIISVREFIAVTCSLLINDIMQPF